VKHHAARLLVYLGYEKMLKNKVYLFDLLEESLSQCPNVATNAAAGPASHGGESHANFATNAHNVTGDKSTAGSVGNNSSQPNSEPLAGGEEDTYISRVSFAPICAFDWPRRSLNGVSVEGVVLTLLQQIEHHINLGETDDEILDLLRENVDRLLIDRLVTKPLPSIDSVDLPPPASSAVGPEGNSNRNVASIVNQSQSDLNFETSIVQALQGQASTESLGGPTTLGSSSASFSTGNVAPPPPPPAIQVDFIGSARSSPRKSLPTSTSATDTGGTILGVDEFGCQSVRDLDGACNSLQWLPNCVHVQRLYLRVFPVVVNPLIVLRLLQHRLFGCLNNYWQWHQPDTAGAYTVNGMSTHAGGYNSRSSFASTCGVESFPGTRSRASSATANSLILPPEFESIGKCNAFNFLIVKKRKEIKFSDFYCGFGLIG
jgi:hypothetical protein